MMWVFLALISAVFAAVTTILMKAGVQNINSYLATAIRTTVVLAAAWIVVFLTQSASALPNISLRSFLFLALSGLSTGASWICYFRALQIGDTSKVVAIDKSSTVLTILMAFIILGEPISSYAMIALLLLTVGTLLMVSPKKSSAPVQSSKNSSWLLFAIGSAVFASLTSILAKIGVEAIDSNLATAIRTIFVLICAWGMVFVQKNNIRRSTIAAKNWVFLILSGFATALSWLSYFKALQLGRASVVVPIDKLSIVITVVFSRIFFKEKIPVTSWVGLGIIMAGTFLLL